LLVSARKIEEQLPKSLKSFLGSSADENILSSSETKHDKRRAPRTNLFVPAWRSQEQEVQTLRTDLDSNLSEDIFYIWETNNGRKHR
jgi:hypothetical protein